MHENGAHSRSDENACPFPARPLGPGTAKLIGMTRPSFALADLLFPPLEESTVVRAVAVSSGVAALGATLRSGAPALYVWKVDGSEPAACFLLAPPRRGPQGSGTTATATATDVHFDEAGNGIHKVFVSPTGSHALASTRNGDIYVLHTGGAFAATRVAAGEDHGAGGRRRLSPSFCSDARQGAHHHRGRKGTKGSHKPGRRSTVVISAVAWSSPPVAERASHVALLGSTDGRIFEALVEAREGVAHLASLKEVYRLGRRSVQHGNARDLTGDGGFSVCGLAIERFPAIAPAEPATFAVIAVVSRPTRLYTFIGGPTLNQLFTKYNNDRRNEAFDEIPSDLQYAELHLFTKYLQERAAFCALLTGVGIYSSVLVYGSKKLIVDYTLLPYPDGAGCPTSIAVTEFHFMLLYTDPPRPRILVVSKLNGRKVAELPLAAPPRGRPGGAQVWGLARDGSGRGTVWVWEGACVRAFQQVVVVSEDRGVWRLYLDRATSGNPTEFQDALAHCKTDRARNRVLHAQAEYYFAGGQYELAAKYYARTRTSFEEAVLRLCGKGHALKTFLRLKMESFAPTDKTQRAIVGAWLVELFLEQLGRAEGNAEQRVLGEGCKGGTGPAGPFRNGNGTSGGPSGLHERDGDHADVLGRSPGDFDQLRGEFYAFLRANRRDLGRPPTSNVIFNLLASHGRVEELLFFAGLLGDLERVIATYIQRGDHGSAVRVLCDQAYTEAHPTAIAEDLYYKFSPLLIDAQPQATAEAWISAQFLSPRKLMPAIVRHTQRRAMRHLRRRAWEVSAGDDKAFVFLDDGERSEPGTPPGASADGRENRTRDIATRYLDHCVNVNWNRDPAVHNYLLSLYAKSDNDTALLQFLQSHCGGAGAAAGVRGENGGNDKEEDGAAALDLKYALRVCSRAGMDRACVQIYSAMCLYDEAVHRALAMGDVALAKLNADHPEDEATRKRLWKRIARFVIRAVARKNCVHKAAISVLKESGVLTIEDVLPFCPALSSVGAFKAQICDALQAYTEQARAY